MPSILFVCLGNICRSPAAEGILKHQAAKAGHQDLRIESCGLGDWHVGSSPDLRMQQSAQVRGVPLTSRAKQFIPEYLNDFDYILAADHEVLHGIYRYAKTPEQKAKTQLITAFSEYYRGQDIPDPYYEGQAGFDLVLDMLEDSCQGLLEHLYGKKLS